MQLNVIGDRQFLIKFKFKLIQIFAKSKKLIAIWLIIAVSKISQLSLMKCIEACSDLIRLGEQLNSNLINNLLEITRKY